MGMFEKDKLFAPDGRMTDAVKENEDFILVDAEIVSESFETDLGNATMTHLSIVAIDDLEGNVRKVSTLSSPIAEKIKGKEEGDLPAVVRWKMVETEMNDACVLQFVRELEDQEKERVMENVPF